MTMWKIVEDKREMVRSYFNGKAIWWTLTYIIHGLYENFHAIFVHYELIWKVENEKEK